jgi:hypothetical protein
LRRSLISPKLAGNKDREDTMTQGRVAKLARPSRRAVLIGGAGMAAGLATPAMWGSDWPHIPICSLDTGALLNKLTAWCPDAVSRRKLLVDNPARLYRF